MFLTPPSQAVHFTSAVVYTKEPIFCIICNTGTYISRRFGVLRLTQACSILNTIHSLPTQPRVVTTRALFSSSVTTPASSTRALTRDCQAFNDRRCIAGIGKGDGAITDQLSVLSAEDTTACCYGFHCGLR